jgi:hypothetical protein
MSSKIHAIAATATFLISAPVWVAQASAHFPVAPGASAHKPVLGALPSTDISARRHYQYRHGYPYYRPTFPYDGYRPYPPPIYQCPYYGSPVPLYPYCWGW